METGPEISEITAQRLANLKKLEEKGFKPSARPFQRTGRLSEIRAAFEENKAVTAAGRLTAIRTMGKSVFADLRDGSDRFQIYLQKNHVGDAAFDAFACLDIGDHIGVEGTLFVTRMGEQTIKVDRWTFLSKALRPLPEKWHGLRDVEARYRQRYLDLIANPEVREFFNKRTRAIQEIRRYLTERGFDEVETPMMQPIAGGAAARPFVTHYGALDADMHLRIAPELYLKRLLVGGFDKVFELNRNFRNEGLSRTHNPEFTMIEIYEAYSDVRGMMELAQGLIAHVAQTVFGTLQVGEGEKAVDLQLPWREVAYRDLVKEKMGAEWFDLPAGEMRARAEKMGLAVQPDWKALDITHEVYEKAVEHTLRNPTFVSRLPVQLVPLARQCEDDPTLADVVDLVIAGKEIAPAYTELNDAVEQRRRFEERAERDAQKLDEDFLVALEHGMPPAGGMGIGVDRLMMALSGQDAIRDVILFPQLRPKKEDA